MQSSNIPTKFSMPFGKNAGASYIRTIPAGSQIGITPGAASLNDGFPPLCFQPVGSGGVPPSGQDFNGLLYQATAWLQWMSAGGPIYFDVTFAAAIGGYPRGAILSSSTTPGILWISTIENNSNNPDTGGAGWIQLFQTNLQGAQTYYVATTGSDANPGTNAQPFATLQKAANTAAQYNLNGYSVTINVANGTYASVNLPPVNGSGQVNFVGNPASPQSCIIQTASGSAIFASNVGNGYTFNGFEVIGGAATANDPGDGVRLWGQTSMILSNMAFGSAIEAHIGASTGALAYLNQNMIILGSAAQHIYISTNASIETTLNLGSSNVALNVAAAVNFSYFIRVNECGVSNLTYSSITNPSNVSGQKYRASFNGIIYTNSGNINYFPGTVAGDAVYGGQYY